MQYKALVQCKAQVQHKALARALLPGLLPHCAILQLRPTNRRRLEDMQCAVVASMQYFLALSWEFILINVYFASKVTISSCNIMHRTMPSNDTTEFLPSYSIYGRFYHTKLVIASEFDYCFEHCSGILPTNFDFQTWNIQKCYETYKQKGGGRIRFDFMKIAELYMAKRK